MAIISHKVEGVSNDVTHYARVYPVNKKGHAQSELDGQIASALTNAFPAEPTSYALIGTYSSSQTFTAPEDGWYQIELFGRSGAGGSVSGQEYEDETDWFYWVAAGGGGGGGAYCHSNRIKLNKGDTIAIVISTTCTVTINSTTGETYSVMKCTTGANGGNGRLSGGTSYGGSGGSGGTASGGNVANKNGNSGSSGGTKTGKAMGSSTYISANGGSGGSASHTGGNAGGVGASGKLQCHRRGTLTTTASAGSAKAGFCKIYRGDTNVVAA